MASANSNLVAIGRLADATGLAVDTIRAWERRYGRPRPIRLPSGHRRYDLENVHWLRKAAEAVARGHRPSEVVPLEDSDLDALLSTVHEGTDPLSVHLETIVGFDTEALRRDLRRRSEGLSVPEVVTDVVSPLVEAVGRAWAEGQLDIRHEHFVTDIIVKLLSNLEGSSPPPDGAEKAVLSTLPGEPHGLGLAMATVFFNHAGIATVNLGTTVPAAEIVDAANECGASVVGISVSSFSVGPKMSALVRDLRTQLPEQIELVVGGHGARLKRRTPSGITYARDFDALSAWLKSRR